MVLFRKNTPRWLIFTIDIFICLVSIVLAYLLRFNFAIDEIKSKELVQLVVPLVLVARALSFWGGKTYAGIIRYTSTKDAERLFIVISAGSIFFILINIISFYFVNSKFIIPFSIIIIDFLVSIFTLTFFRLLVKTLYMELSNPKKNKTNVIIYGTDEMGIIAKRAIDRDGSSKFNTVAFIDNSKRHVGKKLEGVTIYNSDDTEVLLAKFEVSHVIFAKKYVAGNRKKEIIEECLNHNVKVLSIPDVSKWINGELSVNQLKKIRIEDLLERDPIELNIAEIKKLLLNKKVLITGAAGSIGSEMVRQVIKFNPEEVILIDQAESALYELELEIAENLNFHKAKIIVGDITNKEHMQMVFEKYKPFVVFHAAAYKHVPLMETNPYSAVHTNVQGTKTIADLSVEHEVSKFVMISTDKAVNPTNVMGATKRLAEIYTQALNNQSRTRFITTRFGNVLGSNGSVIPRFRKQIESGGPVTVTHPEVTRYFMTIKEACELVLDAGAMGKGGEIFIFDMGKSVRIVDLAKKMIKLSGLSLGKDIHLIFTGLRPGEKLYEELLADKENTLPTPHPEIMIAKVRSYKLDEVKENIQQLIDKNKGRDEFEIVKAIKDIIPEFISKNSKFEELDSAN